MTDQHQRKRAFVINGATATLSFDHIDQKGQRTAVLALSGQGMHPLNKNWCSEITFGGACTEASSKMLTKAAIAVRRALLGNENAKLAS